MGFFGPTQVQCPAGQWTTVVSSSFAQMPKSYRVRFLSDPYGGAFEETGSSWIFPGAPRQGPVAPVMVFERGYWNTFYTVKICPGANVVVEVD